MQPMEKDEKEVHYEMAVTCTIGLIQGIQSGTSI